jgi:uncharacterized caspase-like protein
MFVKGVDLHCIATQAAQCIARFQGIAVGAFFFTALRFVVLSALWLSTIASLSLAQSKKVALVIGNTAYEHARPLPNARSDAAAVSEALTRIGFEVTTASDLDYSALREAIRQFGRVSNDADMAIVYFAGHGLETGGKNWLAPVSAKLSSASDLEYEAVTLDSVVQSVRGARRLRLIILDACRNDPLPATVASATRSAGSRGLAVIEPSGDILVAYSAKHGTVAEDGPPGGRSPFAAALLTHLPTPGLDIRLLMGRVRDGVIQATNRRQEPFTYGSIGGDAVPLVSPTPGAATADGTAVPTLDELAWMRALSANRLETMRKYMAEFPSGLFAAQAKELVERLAKLQSRWEPLKTSRDRKLVEAFILAAENTEFSAGAKQRLIDLSQSEQRDWEKAEDTKRRATYEQFLRDWPNGYLATQAQERVAELDAIAKQWEALKTSNDLTALEGYVRQHGWSEYGAAAVDRLVALRREQRAPNDDVTKVLKPEELAKALDGARLIFATSGTSISFNSKARPPYRTALGNDFMKKALNQPFSLEGGFVGDVVVEGRRQRLEGIGGIVPSKVDGSASIFFMQMHGNEKSANEVNTRDRRFASLSVIEDYFGFVCVMTSWEPLLANKSPQKVVERCKPSR